ncbi:hypothetical protein TNCV_2689451 [Trichonephila clavipes]|nr:hypothetical protein TNCV_2689451 [Trichonephila clavipes]
MMVPGRREHSSFIGVCTVKGPKQIAEIAANLETSVFNDGNQILITILEKFGLKINRNVCVPLAERDNRRIFTSRQAVRTSFEARKAKKIKMSKEIGLFQEHEDAGITSEKCIEVNLNGEGLMLGFPDVAENSSR